MDPIQFRNKHGPEWEIQQELIAYLEARQWRCEVTNGNAYQTGFPDLYIMHTRFGTRWIDVKNPVNYKFTNAQKLKWPVWHDHNVGIWILVAANPDEYRKLFGAPNWKDYWKPQWTQDKIDLTNLVDDLNNADD